MSHSQYVETLWNKTKQALNATLQGVETLNPHSKYGIILITNLKHDWIYPYKHLVPKMHEKLLHTPYVPKKEQCTKRPYQLKVPQTNTNAYLSEKSQNLSSWI